ncbi:GPI biosynthesis protein family Pig-F-domain-containing protein [Aspergillus leporis]|uniref:GPI biosynthesis protein family Pig-F-domain-containing protein n=1 Tax=Aspergillus leporis TaxID=41062 RepID=A0A5N5WXA3_9EURO|nr:GPI biosynthesis protein family Pig-F-domain-containing protein [Aspergillus leporis]
MASTPPSPLLSQGPTPPKSSPPTPILANPVAKTYAFIHPVLLLALLVLRFNALVADPIPELLGDLPFLALLQIAFVTICLPPAGSSTKPTTTTTPTPEDENNTTSSTGTGIILKPGKPGLRRKNTPKSDSTAACISAKLIPSILSLTLTTLLATPLLTALLILFGAPATTHHPQTILCAAHMAVLTAMPLVYVHGVDGTVWKEVWGAARPGDAVWGGALGTAVGAWFGAVPIPLDWDRPWQAFPITILVGGYIGYAVGLGLGRTVLFGSRLKLEEGGGDGEGVLAEGKKVD